MPWLQIFVALIGFFTAKRKGASNTNAALIGAGAGLATHYVVNQTEWGKSNLSPLNDKIDSWFGIDSGEVDEDNVVTGPDGQVITGPANTTPVKQPDGSIVWVPKGNNSIWGASSDVLKSWGAQGTASVVGVSALASGVKQYAPFILAALGIYLISR